MHSVRNSRKPQENPVDTPGCLAGDTSCSHDGGALLTARVQAHDVVDQQGGERATTATDKKTPSDKKKVILNIFFDFLKKSVILV